jgi:hypothetical protein
MEENLIKTRIEIQIFFKRINFFFQTYTNSVFFVFQLCIALFSYKGFVQGPLNVIAIV